MNRQELNPQNLPELFKQNLQSNNTYFVFATDTVMNSWIDWIVTHPEQSGTDAVPFEKFIAWDKFKNEYLSTSQKGKTAIPTLLRQLFVNDLIEKNAAKPFEQRLKVIINPQDELAKTAQSFADWIGNNLKSLHFWKQRLDMYKTEYGPLDDEDLDYEFLYKEYEAFLQQNNLFEPSWIEQVEFEDKTSKFFIIYPETMQDFDEYTHIFDTTDNITAFYVPKEMPQPKVFVYPDSRRELRTVMLQIVDLVQNKKADWSEIALNIPDIETYRPYIEREFELYQIPYVIKSGLSLTKNCAGRIFREIYDCYNSDYTFDSVRTLLLDECVPWKEDFSKTKEDLIREGNQMRCICSPYETNIWLSAFTTKINHLNKPEDAEQKKYYEDLKQFFLDLQKHVNRFFNADKNTFENIKASWLDFKFFFLEDETKFSEESNNILSRCIKELDNIIQIEKDYAHCNMHNSSPFDFFLTQLDAKTYTPQTNKTGVNIFKYRLAAAASFKYQFVIDSSQANLEIPCKRLTFLNATKRTRLHLTEDDTKLNATAAHIKLYAKPTESADETFVHFSAATDTFAGYAIPHSSLKYIKKDPDLPDLDDRDYILNEKKYIQEPEASLKSITAFQKQMFQNWVNASIQEEQEYKITPRMQQLIERRKDENGLFNISPRGDLESFFPCPRCWILNKILRFHDDSLDTDLMKPFDMGTINHKIIELILTSYKDETLPYFDINTNEYIQNKNGQAVTCTEDVEKRIEQSVSDAIHKIKELRDSPLVIHTLEDQIFQLKNVISAFIKAFLISYENNGFGNCKVYSLEQEYKMQMQNYNYKGYVDCVLITPESDLIIIDFKNSIYAIPASKDYKVSQETGLLADFQMAIYYDLVSQVTKNDVKKAQFFSFKPDNKGKFTITVFNDFSTHTKFEKGFEEFESAVLVAREYATDFVDVINEKNFSPYQSDNDRDRMNVKPYEACQNCSFKTFCRTTYNVGAKTIAKKGAGND